MDSENARQRPFQIVTPAERIKQLNEIDKDVTKLLESAGEAIRALTNAKLSSPSNPSPTADSSASSNEGMTPLELHHVAFRSSTSAFFSLLSSIDVRLRRQIYSLEEANIIPSSHKKAFSDQQAANPMDAGGVVGNLGNIDVGYLNGRNGKIGRVWDEELWAQMRTAIQRFKEANGMAVEPDKADDEDEEMKGIL